MINKMSTRKATKVPVKQGLIHQFLRDQNTVTIKEKWMKNLENN